MPSYAHLRVNPRFARNHAHAEKDRETGTDPCVGRLSDKTGLLVILRESARRAVPPQIV